MQLARGVVRSVRGRRKQARPAWVPDPRDIALHEGHIYWTHTGILPICAERDASPLPPEDPDSLLSRFCALGDAPDSRIAAFAKKNGVLGLTKDQRPPGYGVDWLTARNDPPGFSRRAGSWPWRLESCDSWRRYATAANAVLRMVEGLNHAPPRSLLSILEAFVLSLGPWGVRGPEGGLSASAALLQAIIHCAPRHLGRFAVAGRPDLTEPAMWAAIHQAKVKPDEIRAAFRLCLLDEVSEWLRYGGLTLALDFDAAARPDPGLGFALSARPQCPEYLFGWLAYQLAGQVAASRPLAICQGCERAFASKYRAPKEKQYSWCADCKKSGVPSRFYKRRSRAAKSVD